MAHVGGECDPRPVRCPARLLDIEVAVGQAPWSSAGSRGDGPQVPAAPEQPAVVVAEVRARDATRDRRLLGTHPPDDEPIQHDVAGDQNPQTAELRHQFFRALPVERR